MGFGYTTTFSLIEWLALTGFVQGILILVYICFRVRNWRQTSLAIIYFGVLTASFGLQFALRLDEYENAIRLGRFIMLALAPALCYLLVLQIAQPGLLPRRVHFSILLLPASALLAGFVLYSEGHVCSSGWGVCPEFFETMHWLGSLSGGVCMLLLWGRRDVLGALWADKKKREQYWLALMLAAANVLSVGVSLFRSTGYLSRNDSEALWIMLGMTFIYLASTALFRIYPAPVQLNKHPINFLRSLAPEEKQIAEKVQKLMELDKVYHEPTFSRADLAREVGVSESVLSKVINVHFGKSFPRLLNEFRVEDAKRMLADANIPVQVVASEVGFNSIASFNRAFKEIAAESPSSFRARQIQAEIKP